MGALWNTILTYQFPYLINKRSEVDLSMFAFYVLLYVSSLPLQILIKRLFLLFIDRSSVENLKRDNFDGSRKDINAAIDRICEFTGKDTCHLVLLSLNKFGSLYFGDVTGTKIIFWDLREPFIDNLYKPSVSQSRLEALVDPLDIVRFVLLTSFYIV